MTDVLARVRLNPIALNPAPARAEPSVDDWRRGRNVAPTPRADLVLPFKTRPDALAEPKRGNPLDVPRERAVAAWPVEREPGGYSLTYLKVADASTLAISGNVLLGNDLAFPFPAVGSEAELGDGTGVLEREDVRFAFERVKLPDGTEIHKGTGKMVLIERDGEIVGLLKGSVQLDPGTATVVRAQAAPVALPGHRGVPGELRYGGAILKDAAVVGVAALSEATLDGLRVQTRETATSFTFTAPDTYSLGAGATVMSTPADRRIVVRGEGFDVLDQGRRVRVQSGAVAFEAGRYVGPLEGTQLRVLADREDPAPRADHRALSASGGLVKLSAVEGAALFRNGVSWRDVTQGTVGDCFLMAPVLAIARHRPDLIKDIVTDLGDGTYRVRLFKRDGTVREQVVDADAYYVTQPHVGPVYSRSADRLELWGPVIEKAYASLVAGDYHTLDEGGVTEEALQALTGVRPETWNMWLHGKDALFAAVQDAVRKGEPVVTATGSFLEMRTAELAEQGLVDRHAYVVIDAYEDAGQRWLVLHNPWGNFELRNRGYEVDVDVDGNGSTDGNDGTFRITLDDWKSLFSRMAVAHLPPAAAPR